MPTSPAAISATDIIERVRIPAMASFDVSGKAEVREWGSSGPKDQTVQITTALLAAGLAALDTLPHPGLGGAGIAEPAAFKPGLHDAEPELARPHDPDRDAEGNHEVEDPEHHQRRQQLFLAELRQRH